MDFPTQQMIGLPIQQALLMLSQTTGVSGMIPMMMVMVITWNTSMAKPRGMPTVEMAAKRQKGPRHSIAGAVLIVTKMVGQTQQVRGLQAPEVEAMLGRWTQLNGMTSMVMDVATTLEVQPPTFVQTKQVPQSGPLQVATDGAVQTPMVMAGPI
jgi:hypothetical protein